MVRRAKGIDLTVVLLFSLFAVFPLCFSAIKNPLSKKKPSQPAAVNGFSTLFRVQGNVYPIGYYYVPFSIGSPPKIYDLDIDSGSDLTWVQCDAPCTGCTKPRESLYKPNRNLVTCSENVCSAIHQLPNQECSSPNDQCDYEVEYADSGSSLGVLVRDLVPLRLTNGSIIGPRLAFGCGYDYKFSGSQSPLSTAGVLGLGNGKASIISQLHAMGLTRNVIGHCFGGQGGGYLFIGDEIVPSTGISWTSILPSSLEKHYAAGPADVLFGGQPTSIKGLDVIFDSGSSYTYFSSQVYKSILDLVTSNLKGKQLTNEPQDRTLPVCWKGSKAFKSLRDVSSYFKPLALTFSKSKNVQLQLPSENYLIISKKGNACLGILNGTEVGLGYLNIIGDISLQDKMVIYDNELQQIGWVSSNCDRLPNVDRDFDEGLSLLYAANLGTLEEQRPAIFTDEVNTSIGGESFHAN